MRKKHIIGLSSVLLISSGFLSGCLVDDNIYPEEMLKAENNNKKNKDEKTVQTLAEQGFVIESINSYGENEHVVYIKKGNKEYIGVVDDSFKWIIEPTDKYEHLGFHDGLAAITTPETREMILVNNSKAVLYGFMNNKGDITIEPNYRYAYPFSDGVAIVQTIEEDRDDLMNSRWVVIDKRGNEIAQLTPSELYTKEWDKDKEVTSFIGGYAYANAGFYDKKGIFTPMDLSIKDYIVINGKRFENVKEENVVEIVAKNLNGDEINRFKVEGENLDIVSIDEVDYNTIQHLAKNNVILVNGENTRYLLDGASLNVLLRGNIDTSLGEGLIFIEDVASGAEENTDGKYGTFFDYNGNKVAAVTNMIGPLLNDRYFTLGDEYYKLVDINGNVLIDEDRKITDVEVLYYDDKTTNPYKHMIKIHYREDATDVDPNEALLNVETLEIKDTVDLLEYVLKENKKSKE